VIYDAESVAGRRIVEMAHAPGLVAIDLAFFTVSRPEAFANISLIVTSLRSARASFKILHRACGSGLDYRLEIALPAPEQYLAMLSRSPEWGQLAYLIESKLLVVESLEDWAARHRVDKDSAER